jgi:hypothetical protein
MGRLGRAAVFAAPGCLIWVCGFLYLAIIVGIPYQDPPPALAAEYERRSEIGERMARFGMVTALLGVVVGAAWRKRRNDQ